MNASRVIICQVEVAQHVQVKWLIVQHVQPMEHHVQNVIQDITSLQQRHVRLVQANHNVQHVHKHQMHVRNAIPDIIPVEQDVLHVQQ